MPRKIIHLDLDAFFCAVEELLRPELRGKAFAVGGRADSRGVIASCSYPARQYGVHSAMPTGQALRLCPGLILVQGRHGTYGEYSQQVMDILGRYTALIEQVSIDEAFLDLSDLPEDGRTLAERLQAAINRELKLPCSLGVATNKLVAKVASDQAKATHKTGTPPNAILVIPPGQEAAFFAPLPAQALIGIGKKTAQRLTEMGIKTLGDLAAQPESLLSRHFGKYGAEMVHRARGEDDSPVVTGHGVKSISQETTFDRDISDRAALLQTLRRLSEMVGRRLRQQQFVANTVRLKLRWANFTTLTRQTTLTPPTDQDSVLFEAITALLDQAWPGTPPIRLVGVGAANLEEATHQLPLWDSNREKEHRLLTAVDTLRERYGDTIIRRASTLPHAPEPPMPIAPEKPPSSPAVQASPIPNAYWVVPGRFLAGEMPAAINEAETRLKLGRLLDAGLTHFIDLSIPGETGLYFYPRLLAEESDRRGVRLEHIPFPIADMDIPDRETMEAILKTITDLLANGHNLYLHCWAGRGRTGTVVGCYLVRQGLSGEQALDRIRLLRQSLPNNRSPSPESPGQIMAVLTWS